MDLTGKVVIVTGSGEGIGRASALRFVAAGSRLVVADIDEGKGQETVQLIRGAGGTSEFVQTDVTVEAQVRAMVDFAVARFGRIDCAHNNAGGPGKVPHRPVDETNELGMGCDRRSQPQGRIFVHEARASSYARSRRGGDREHRLRIGTSWKRESARLYGREARRGGADEVGRDGLREAGHTYKRYLSRRDPDRTLLAMRGEAGGNEFAVANMPIGRGANPAEVAGAAVWLCSDAASCITGAVLAVDGGMTAL